MPRPLIYLGVRPATVAQPGDITSGGLAFRIIRPDREPTHATHGAQFSACIGPFRTLRAARFMASTSPNPHARTVAEAERLATPSTL